MNDLGFSLTSRRVEQLKVAYGCAGVVAALRTMGMEELDGCSVPGLPFIHTCKPPVPERFHFIASEFGLHVTKLPVSLPSATPSINPGNGKW
mmetsp:Transcript_44378/g.60622  ORF Transcript_44378/g.60622 Transcript_44378/m.60622 type:complete len:92 (-) Transcript_44378:39-314(-)